MKHRNFFLKAGLSGFTVLFLPVIFFQPVWAEENKPVQTLKEVTVKAVREDQKTPFLADVEGTKIYAGKKTTAIDFNELPPIQNNNYRQALAQVPGLLVSEETTPLLSIGYRGLNPDRVQFMQVMKDGVPIVADLFGYPEAYYAPMFQSVDRIEFIRGGSALLYGPQPGGALNYVTKKPATDVPFRVYTENTFGSDNYFSNYTALTGTGGLVGYYGYFHERQTDGFRQANSDVEVISGSMKVVLNQKGKTRFTAAYEEYHEEHGEPGGLTLAGTFSPNYNQNRDFTNRYLDRFRLERYYGYGIFEKEFSDQTQLDVRVYGGKYRRFSKRARSGGFGTFPTARNNDVQDQFFYNLGFEPRVRHDYSWLGGEHTLAIGTHNFFSNSPRFDLRGEGPGNDSGTLRKESVRDSFYFSMFLENLFRWGKLSLVPGVRLENFWQRINEKRNLDKTTLPLDRKTESSFVPLFGLGISYELFEGIEAYTNISQSYRPKTFTQSVGTGSNEIVVGDLKEGRGVQYDFGLRGKPVSFANWDVDYFLMTFEDQVGTVGNAIQNVGDSLHQGFELASEVDLVDAYDHFNKTGHKHRIGTLAPYLAYQLLDAKFDEGRNKGREPAFAPRHTFKFGTNYRWRDRVKLSLTSTFLSDHFADDASTLNRKIPSYKVWDLLGEVQLVGNDFSGLGVNLFAGINNIFDEEYYARITGNGIDPAYGRNGYVGFKFSW